MSNLIFVWNPRRHGAVNDIDQLSAKMEELADRVEAEPDPQIQAFVEELTEDYPTAAMDPTYDSVWRGEDILDYGKAMVTARHAFTLADAGNAALFGTLLEAATNNGLAVYDSLQHWVWLPDGSAYPAQAKTMGDRLRELAGPPIERKLGWGHWAHLMNRAITPILVEAGFADVTDYPLKEGEIPGKYSRIIQGGKEDIFLFVDRIRSYGAPDDGRFGVRLSVSHTFDEIIRCYREYWKSGSFGVMEAFGCGFFLGIESSNGRLYDQHIIEIESEEGRRLVIETMRDKVLPFLNATRKMSDLDNVINRGVHPIAATARITANRLLIAKLCGNPDYAKMREIYRGYADVSSRNAEYVTSQLEALDRVPPG